jgi:hypothetical protein
MIYTLVFEMKAIEKRVIFQKILVVIDFIGFVAL